MVSWPSAASQFWNEWAVRIVVLSSFAANVILVLLAGIRRRQASGWGTLLLWLAYQLGDMAATYALGNLSLSRSSGASSPEHQLVAFWAPFLRLHLGGPDNISAYALEDNKLSLRQGLHVLTQVLGASYLLYKDVVLGGSGVLLPASAIMLILGVAKYAERACALWRGHLGGIRSSSSKKSLKPWDCELLCFTSGSRKLGNERALLFAHGMFHFCKRAMVDSAVEPDAPAGHGASQKIFSLPWRSMCKVVEMELSLMYDILYTKAAVVHTWGGYLIRFISPFGVAIAAMLFWIYPKDEQRRADVVITYILLSAAFLMELTWLLRALTSTWTFAFLSATPWGWLQHKALCRGWWRRLRRFVLSLVPCRLLGEDPSSYRFWSGTIGRYNLLLECTRDRAGKTGRLCGTLATMVGLDDTLNEYQHSRCFFELPTDVKRLLFQRIQRRLRLPSTSENADASYSMQDITTRWGHVAARRRPSVLENVQLRFGREFQEDILVWHIGTCIFLACADQQFIYRKFLKPAIEALSEYLMFLVAVRRHMLPGLALHSLFEVTLQALNKVWAKRPKQNGLSRFASGKEELAHFLHKERFDKEDWGLDDAKSRLLSDGAELAVALLIDCSSDIMPQLLELVFDVWVDKLLYAGTRCSREAHAKQLSRGGELTTNQVHTTRHIVHQR